MEKAFVQSRFHIALTGLHKVAQGCPTVQNRSSTNNFRREFSSYRRVALLKRVRPNVRRTRGPKERCPGGDRGVERPVLVGVAEASLLLLQEPKPPGKGRERYLTAQVPLAR